MFEKRALMGTFEYSRERESNRGLEKRNSYILARKPTQVRRFGIFISREEKDIKFYLNETECDSLWLGLS
jgi:hypothetical protein